MTSCSVGIPSSSNPATPDKHNVTACYLNLFIFIYNHLYLFIFIYIYIFIYLFLSSCFIDRHTRGHRDNMRIWSVQMGESKVRYI